MKTLFILILLLPSLGRANSRSDLPVLYGKGAAGITFATTYEEAQKVLKEKSRSSTAAPIISYEEGILVQWNPATGYPNYIMITNDYHGPVQTSPNGVSVSLGQNYSNRYPSNTYGTELLARHLFQTFENVDPSFDCIDKELCRVKWNVINGQAFLIELPGMDLHFQRDPIVLLGITIINPYQN